MPLSGAPFAISVNDFFRLCPNLQRAWVRLLEPRVVTFAYSKMFKHARHTPRMFASIVRRFRFENL